MSLISVVQDVCAFVGVTRPSSIFSGLNSSRTQQELLAHANEAAQTIAYESGHDWNRLKQYHQFGPPGTPPDPVLDAGPSEYYPLPADYQRLLQTSEVWRSSNYLVPLTFIPDTQQWVTRRFQHRVTAPGDWTITLEVLHIAPPLTPQETAYFIYLNKNCVKLAAGGQGDTFQSDNDTFVLPERLLKLCMIWRWKASKGSPYAEDMGNYTDALAMAIGKDNPAPTIVGRLPISAAANVAVPWPPGWGPQ
jgi:hypothetical protein